MFLLNFNILIYPKRILCIKRRITLKKRFFIITLFWVFILLMGCSKKDNKNLTVRVGFFPNITHCQALLGKDSKFKEALGENNLEWKQFNAGSSELEALLTENLDIGYIGPAPAINGFIKSKGGIQIIASGCDAGAIIVSRNDVEIKEIKELSGKKIAIPQFGNTQHVILKELLDTNGLKETTKGGNVEIVEADNQDIKTLFDKKAIDAAFISEPWGSKLIEEAKAKVVIEHDKIWKNGNYPVTVLVGRTEFIKNHPEVVEKFIRAHIELNEQIKNDLEGSKEAINGEIKKLTGKSLDSSIIDSSYRRVLITNNVDKEAVVDIEKLMEKLDVIKGSHNIDGIFNFSIFNKVLKEKGYISAG